LNDDNFGEMSVLISRLSVWLSPPHLHFTTSKVITIVWKLRVNIIRTVLCIANVLPLQWAQVTKNSWALILSLFFRLHDLSLFVYVLFYLGQLSHSPSCCGASVTNLNEPPSSFLLPPHYCGLGAG